jgi:DNA-directed RNA polymerase specialized sigma24 family protein
MTDFDDIYRQHLPAVFRYAVRCVGRREVAEEITSEAFVALFRGFDEIDPKLQQ